MPHPKGKQDLIYGLKELVYENREKKLFAISNAFDSSSIIIVLDPELKKEIFANETYVLVENCLYS